MWLLTKSDVTRIIYPILYFLYEGRKDTTQNGLIHLGVFTLLFLSGKREFGVQLNKPFTRKVTIDLPTFTGSYADFLILVFHKMLVDGHPRLESLYECLLTVLANVSPYLKMLSMVTCMKLMNLFKLLSTQKFLFEKPKNNRYAFFLLEVFNNCIQYQYAGNYHLIYALIRNKEVFSALANIQLNENVNQKQNEEKEKENGDKKKNEEEEEEEEEEEREEEGEGEKKGDQQQQGERGAGVFGDDAEHQQQKKKKKKEEKEEEEQEGNEMNNNNNNEAAAGPGNGIGNVEIQQQERISGRNEGLEEHGIRKNEK